MVGRALQLALREMQAHFGDRRVLAGMAVVVLLLGFAGPFGTFAQMGFGARLAYWAAMVVVTYGLGFAVAVFVGKLFGLKVRQNWARVLVFGAIVGLPVTLAVMAVNVAALGSIGDNPLSQWLQCTLIGMGVIAIIEIVEGGVRRREAAAPVEQATAPAREPVPPILERVPLPARGNLWALVVQDHYVEIVTERGRTLVLMRLGDAIREVGATPGVQIHRSHWVALPAVVKVVKADGKPAVELPDGRRLGISRGYMDAARQAGLVA